MSTGAGYFSNAAASDWGWTWNDVSNLTSTSNAAYAESNYSAGLPARTQQLRFDTPDFISTLDGGDFVSMKIEMDVTYVAGVVDESELYLEGGVGYSDGTEFSFTPTASYKTYTYDGDADYWGLTGEPSEIFNRLKAGTIKLVYSAQVGGLGKAYIKEVKCTLTYVIPNTNWPAILITIP